MNTLILKFTRKCKGHKTNQNKLEKRTKLPDSHLPISKLTAKVQK